MTLEACAAMVERGDPDRFIATMAAPLAARALLWPLYAYNLQVARAPWLTQEAMIAEMRLQWWRDAVAEIAAGGAVRAHEVVGPLAAIIRSRGLPVGLLDGLAAARRWDIYRAAFADAAELEAHLQATAGNLMWLAALALGARPEAEGVVRDLAFAQGLATWFRAVPDLEARGRLPLVDGRGAGVRALAEIGLARLARARAGRGQVRGASAALLPGWQAQALLRQVVADPLVVAEGRMGRSEFSRRGGLLWQAVTGRF